MNYTVRPNKMTQYKSQERQWKYKSSDKLTRYKRISKGSHHITSRHIASNPITLHHNMAKTLSTSRLVDPSCSLSSSATNAWASSIINYILYVCVTLAFLAAMLNMHRMPNIDIADDQSIIPSVMVGGKDNNRKMNLLNKGKENENQSPSKDSKQNQSQIPSEFNDETGSTPLIHFLIFLFEL